VVLTNTFSGRPQEDIADAIDYVVLTPKGIDAKVRAIFDALQHARPDRTVFTSDFNAYLDARTAADYSRTLSMLGPPSSFHQTSSSDRGGMKFYEYRIVAGGKRLALSIYVTPEGKFEQFLISAAVN
jgi:D-alanyl-D-alanine carboxypeptidase